MKKIILLLSSIVVALLMTGCGDKVQINSGEVGKQLTTSGLESEIRESGSFRMDGCAFSACPKLVRLQVTKTPQIIPGKFFMPKSDLTLGLDIAIQYQVKTDNASRNIIFNEVSAQPSTTNDREMIILSQTVYDTFIKPTLRDTVRKALSQYKIEGVMDNLSKVREFVESEVKKSLKDSPVTVVTLAFENISYPALILESKEQFAAIETQKATEMKAMAAEMEIIAKKLEVEKARANVALEVDKIISDHMDDKLATWGIIQAAQTSAENGTPWAISTGVLPVQPLAPKVKK